MRIWHWLGLWLLIGGLTACARAIPSTPTPTPTPSPVPSPTVTPTWTPSPVPSPTATPGPKCLTAPVTPGIPQSWSYPSAQAGDVVAALQAGMTPEALNDALQRAGIGAYPRAVTQADLDGDGQADYLIALFDPQSTQTPPEGVLLVVLRTAQGFCQVAAYRGLFAGEPGSVPIVHEVADLDGDGRDEVVLGVARCGAHTCFEAIGLFAWRDGQWQNLLEGETTDLPNPIVTLRGPDEQGRYQVAVEGSGAGSVGAGPQRPVTRVWGYDAQTGRWQVVAEEVPPPQVRIHALHDADRAAAEGRLTDALLLYGRVVSDVELSDEGFGDPQELHALLAAYARFRILVLHAWAGHDALAAATYAEIQRTVPTSGPLAPYRQLAEVFYTAYQAQGFEAACQAARDFAAQHAAEVLDPLGPQRFGYANKTYTPEMVCP